MGSFKHRETMAKPHNNYIERHDNHHITQREEAVTDEKSQGCW